MPYFLPPVKTRKKPAQETQHQFVKDATDPNAKKLTADKWTEYQRIADDGTTHGALNRPREGRLCGDAHTNGLEGAWSLFERSLVGSYHQASAKDLDRHLDEFRFRLHNRNNPFLLRDSVLRLPASQNME